MLLQAPSRKNQKDAYIKLLSQIRTTVFKARHKIERSFVQMYWMIGKSLCAFLKKNGPALPGGQSVYQQLAGDLDVDNRTLYQTVRFYKAYPRLDYSLPLSWSHYRHLSAIDAPGERRQWERRIIRDNLSISQFLQARRRLRLQSALPARTGKLPLRRGRLFHYRLVKARYQGSAKSEVVVDCGFDNYISPPRHHFKLDNKRVVSAHKDGRGFFLRLSKAVRPQIYTYIAYAERVIDGDTLLVHIDCGFGMFRKERLRLKGIDAPEKTGIAGRQAARFLEAELARVKFAVIKTYWEDKYGRYLADVFYQPGEGDPAAVARSGLFLNQLMLDEGQAEVYTG